MKKRYILETSDNCQRITLIGDCDGCVVMMDKAVDKLQDADKAIEEAYLQGKHDAEQDIASAAYDEAYQKGLCDGTARNENGCVGCRYDDGTIEHSPCNYCCNAYSNQWQAKSKSNKFKIGEEVITPNNKRAIVIDVDVIEETNATIVKVLKGTYTWWYKISELTKTGRYFPQIEELFKAMEEGVK